MVLTLTERVDKSINKLLADMLAEATPKLRRRIRECPTCHQFFYRRKLRIKCCSRKCAYSAEEKFKQWSYEANREIFAKPTLSIAEAERLLKTVDIKNATVSDLARRIGRETKKRVTQTVTEQALWKLRLANEVMYDSRTAVWSRA